MDWRGDNRNVVAPRQFAAARAGRCGSFGGLTVIVLGFAWLFGAFVPRTNAPSFDKQMLVSGSAGRSRDRLEGFPHNLGMKSSYRCEAKSVEGFVQQVACAYLRHGYWFYVMGRIPADKDPSAIDAKLLAKYDIAVSESTRARRKKRGLANLQYLRHERTFVLLATLGRHEFKQTEAIALRDIRRVPIKFQGYSISYRRGGRTRSGETDARWHAHVEIERERLKEIRDHLLHLAKHHLAQRLALEFYQLPFEPYAPVRRQMLKLLRAVNQARKQAGFDLLPMTVLPLRRRIVRPFERTNA